jgi:hypothetical protein
MVDLEQQIRGWLRRYLDGGITLEAFEDWFVEAGWDIEDGPRRELVRTVERYLSEYSGAYRDKEALRTALAHLVANGPPLPG